MAVRFLIIAVKHGMDIPSGLTKLRSVCGLKCVFRGFQLAVFCSSAEDVVVIPKPAGVVIGQLFERGPASGRIRTFNRDQTHRLHERNAGNLLTDYWGGYVAVHNDLNQKITTILRDPSGSLPCFWFDAPAYTAFASDLDLLLEVGLIPTVNWTNLQAHILSCGLATSATCLSGVRELLPGNRMVLRPTGSDITEIWTPWDYIEEEDARTDDEIAERLCATVTSSVAAWAKCFNHLLLAVSGGLDSSIVAAALANSGIDFTAFTMSTPDSFGDERVYARSLARKLKFELLEFQHCHNDIDLTRSAAAHAPRPGMSASGQSNLKNQQAIAGERNIDAFFNGIGGDNVFCSMQSATPLVDQFRHEGLTWGVCQTLVNISRMTGASIWDILKMAIQTPDGKKGAYHWNYDWSFMSVEDIDTVSALMQHSWLRKPDGASRGKAVHIARLMIMQIHSQNFRRQLYGPMILPLLSQPVVELCLSIPTWKWCAGGENRAVARRAFEDLLPVEIVRRKSKGTPDNFACQVVERNKPLLRSLLLDGCLMEHGLLNKADLEQCLKGNGLVHARDHARISSLAEAEAWARGWCDKKGKTRFQPTSLSI